MSLQVIREEEIETEAVDDEYGPPVREEFPLYTAVLIGCIAAVGIAQYLFGLALSVDAAGFDKPVFTREREYWRILTGAALHGGILHLVLNSYALFSFGRLMEMLANRAHVAIVFLLAAIGGGILSLIFVPDGRSVGASGGVVGLIGYLAVYAFRRSDFISTEFRRSLLFNIGFIFLYGLLMYRVIDNFGHLGGLVTGAVYGLLQIPSDPHTDPGEASPVTRIFGYGALLIFIATSILSIMLIANFG